MSTATPADIPKILDALHKTKFWGEVLIVFKDGIPVQLRKTEQVRLADGPPPLVAGQRWAHTK